MIATHNPAVADILFDSDSDGVRADWHLTTLSLLDDITPLLDIIVDAMDDAGYSERDRFSVRLSLEEVLVNSIRHGHQCDPKMIVFIRHSVTTDDVIVQIRDQGPGFAVSRLPDPTSPEALERPHGRGVFLMRRFMSWVHFNELGNQVTLCKHRTDRISQAESHYSAE